MKHLLSAAQIDVIVARLAREISAAMPAQFTLLALMDGALMISADLLRALHDCGVNPNFKSLSLSSYGDVQTSSGVVTINAKRDLDFSGRTVLIVDDVLETGRTLAAATQYVHARGAAEVKTCVFARKPYNARSFETVDFTGWDAPDEFLVGYGLDDAGKYRGQPFIGSI